MYGCESWTIKKTEHLKNWCLLTMMLEKTLESPLDCKEVKPVNPRGNQSWIFIGRTDAEEAEAPILWPSDSKNWLIGKDPDAGKGWRQEEKGMTEDEMVGWHHRLNGHEFEWTLGVGDVQGGVGDVQGGLVCCGSWGHKELDTTEGLKWLNWFSSGDIAIVLTLRSNVVESKTVLRDFMVKNLPCSIGTWVGFLVGEQDSICHTTTRPVHQN